MARVDGKSIDVPAPAVPASDHRSDQLFLDLRYEQGGWTAVDETFDVLASIRRAGVLAASERPETKDRVKVVRGASPNLDLRTCQVRSLSAGRFEIG